jgi:hypothetical protein
MKEGNAVSAVARLKVQLRFIRSSSNAYIPFH